MKTGHAPKVFTVHSAIHHLIVYVHDLKRGGIVAVVKVGEVRSMAAGSATLRDSFDDICSCVLLEQCRLLANWCVTL